MQFKSEVQIVGLPKKVLQVFRLQGEDMVNYSSILMKLNIVNLRKK